MWGRQRLRVWARLHQYTATWNTPGACYSVTNDQDCIVDEVPADESELREWLIANLAD